MFRLFPLNSKKSGWSLTRIRYALEHQQWSKLKSVLLRGKYQERQALLQEMHRQRTFQVRLCRPLIRILKSDSLANGQIALDLLEGKIQNYPDLAARFYASKAIFYDRKRRQENKTLSHQQYRFENGQTMIDKKREMKMLEKVRGLLKKGMHF